MAIQSYNSAECAWEDLEVFINGLLITKILGMKWKWTRETEHIYGAGSDPIGIQRGNRAGEGEIKLYKGQLDELNRAAMAAGRQDITDVNFQIVCTYKATDETPMQTDTLIDCVVGEFERGMEQNAKKMEISLPFKFLRKIST